MSDPAAPSRSRLGGVARFLLANQLHTAVTLVTGLVATPILLHWLGPARFGLVRVLDAWVAYLGIGMHCLSIAAGTALVGRLAKGDWAAVNRLLATAVALSAVVGGLVVAVGLCFLGALPALIPAPDDLADERRTAFLIALAGNVCAPLAFGRVLFDADQRGYRVSLLLTAAAVVTVALNLAAAWLGFGVPGQVAAGLIVTNLQLLALVGWARASYPRVRPAAPTRGEAGELGRLAAHILASSVFGVVAARAEVVVANFLLGPDAVTKYFLTQRLFALWAGQVSALGGALWAPFGDLYHRGELAVLRARVRTAAYLVVGVAFAAAVPFVGYVEHFLRLWVRDDQYAGPAAAAAFAVTLPLTAVQVLQGWLIAGTGFSRQNIPSWVVYAAVSVAGCAGFGALAGLPGVAAGMAVASAVLVATNAWVARACLGVPASAFVAPLAVGTAVAVPLGALAAWAAAAHVPYGWIGLLAEMGGWFVAFCVAWWAVLPRAERAEWRALLRRVLPGKRA